MSNEVKTPKAHSITKTGAKATELKPRKATFQVKLVKGKRVFSAVNRRAHTVCKKAGKRTTVTVSELKKLKDTGTYRYFYYTETGVLKPVKF